MFFWCDWKIKGEGFAPGKLGKHGKHLGGNWRNAIRMSQISQATRFWTGFVAPENLARSGDGLWCGCIARFACGRHLAHLQISLQLSQWNFTTKSPVGTPTEQLYFTLIPSNVLLTLQPQSSFYNNSEWPPIGKTCRGLGDLSILVRFQLCRKTTPSHDLHQVFIWLILECFLLGRQLGIFSFCASDFPIRDSLRYVDEVDKICSQSSGRGGWSGAQVQSVWANAHAWFATLAIPQSYSSSHWKSLTWLSEPDWGNFLKIMEDTEAGVSMPTCAQRSCLRIAGSHSRWAPRIACKPACPVCCFYAFTPNPPIMKSSRAQVWWRPRRVNIYQVRHLAICPSEALWIVMLEPLTISCAYAKTETNECSWTSLRILCLPFGCVPAQICLF